MGLKEDGTMLHSVAALRLVGLPRERRWIAYLGSVPKPGVQKAGRGSNPQ
jgi:hypothetical protein